MHPERMDTFLEDLRGQTQKISVLQRKVVRASVLSSLLSPLTSRPRGLGGEG